MSFFPTPRTARPRLICLPNAGGGTADYRRWRLPQHEVLPARLPGRESRLAERPYRSMAPLIEDLADETPTDRPYAIYGHSLGSWLAFELVRELRRRGARLPTRLLLGARHAPHIPTATPPLGRLPRAAFLDGMAQQYGAIPEVLRNDPALLDAFLPALRADVVMLDDYRYAEQPPLPIPLDLFHATDDPTVAESDAVAWSIHSTERFGFHRVEGGHFFLRQPGFDAVVAGVLG